MKNRIVRIATVVSALLLTLALTFTAFADVSGGVESIVPSNYDPKKNFALSNTTLTYNTKPQCPEVTVTNTEGAVIDASCYTVSYKGNVKPGKATARVIFKGKYKGTKNLKFNIVE